MTKAIEEYTKQHNIFIDDFEMKTKALCVEIDNEYHIAIDEKQFETISELNTAKLHEIGHCESGALYNVNSSPLIKSKCEYQADKWAITHFIRKNILIHYLKQNCPLWEIAEDMGITEPFLIKAINYYFR
jgi:hypothetical protein